MNRGALAAAAPELFGGLSFLFALAFPHALRNFDLVYTSTAIFFLEFIMVHAGVFAATIRGAPNETQAGSRAMVLGIVYGLFAIVFGAAFGVGYAGLFIALMLFWRFLAAIGVDTSAAEFRERGFLMVVLFMVLAMIVILAGFAPRLGVDDSVVWEVRRMEQSRGIQSSFDPAHTTAFLVIWYFVVAVLEYGRVARRPALKPRNALASVGVSVVARPGEVVLERAQPYLGKWMFLAFGAFGLFGGLAGLFSGSISKAPWTLAPIAATLLAGLAFASAGLRSGSQRLVRLTIRRDRVTFVEETPGLPQFDVRRVLTDVKFSPVAVQRETGGKGSDLLVTGTGDSPVRFLCGVPRQTLVAVSRLLIAVYTFGDRPDVLRVTLASEPEVREVLDDADERRLTGEA